MKNLQKINYLISALVIVLGIVSVTMLLQKNTVQAPSKRESAPAYKAVSTFDYWEIACVDDENAEQHCRAKQNIHNQEDLYLSVQLKIINRLEERIPRLKVSAPLGIFLPAGITLTLPGQEAFTVPFQFCEAEGCFINLDLANDVVDALSQSDNLKVSYMRANRAEEELQIKLQGFDKSLEALKSYSK